MRLKHPFFILVILIFVLLPQNCSFDTTPFYWTLGIILEYDILAGTWTPFYSYWPEYGFDLPAGTLSMNGWISNLETDMPRRLDFRAHVCDWSLKPYPQYGELKGSARVLKKGKIKQSETMFSDITIPAGYGLVFSVNPKKGNLYAGDIVNLNLVYTKDVEGEVCEEFRVSTGFGTAVDRASVNPSSLASVRVHNLSSSGGVKVHCKQAGKGTLTIRYDGEKVVYNLICED